MLFTRTSTIPPLKTSEAVRIQKPKNKLSHPREAPPSEGASHALDEPRAAVLLTNPESSSSRTQNPEPPCSWRTQSRRLHELRTQSRRALHEPRRSPTDDPRRRTRRSPTDDPRRRTQAANPGDELRRSPSRSTAFFREREKKKKMKRGKRENTGGRRRRERRERKVRVFNFLILELYFFNLI